MCGISEQFATIEVLVPIPLKPFQTNGGTETEIGHAGDGGFIGLIDEVTIYDRALSQKEIQQNFKAKGLSVDPMGKLATNWAWLKTGL